MNLPIGKSEQKAKFFEDVAKAFNFLALWNRLESNEQEELNQIIAKFQGEVAFRFGKK